MHMDKPTTHPAWRDLLTEQGRTLAWLADQTGWKRRTVYAYSTGQLRPTPAFLEAASRALGVQVVA